MNRKTTAILFAILAAALYAVNVPVSKLLMDGVSPTMLAGFLYLGAGIGIGIMMLGKKAFKLKNNEKYLEKKDLPYTVAMVVLDIAAPIFLMFGVANTSSANVSLLNNFEIVATSVIALVIFREKISKRLWSAIILVIAASAALGYEGAGGFIFNKGSVLVLCACLCWGIENNCTRSISDKSAEQIVLIKGLFSGAGGVIVALAVGEMFPSIIYIFSVMLLGFVSYGLSIKFYIMAQNKLGAAKTSAFYSIAPFLGVGFSFLFLREQPKEQFYIGLALMLAATAIMIFDTLEGGRDIAILNEK